MHYETVVRFERKWMKMNAARNRPVFTKLAFHGTNEGKLEEGGGRREEGEGGGREEGGSRREELGVRRDNRRGQAGGRE
jgi:hypothetical protein